MKVNKVETDYPIALKLGTQKDGVSVNLGTKFGWNMTNNHKIICSNHL